ncbi:MAG: guanylate kinase [Tidjanibacter sp.]|nr:guanylate kinase [Tidjanibacter sp.]
MGKLIIFSAPSGSGKTTIVRRLMTLVEGLEFSVSATSRQPRGTEQNGKDYYFLSGEEFDRKVSEDAFVEWEEVYAGTKYGTLRSELERIWAEGHTILFDVDVKGGVRLKDIFGSDALSIFVMPPSIEELRNRLVGRATDSPEKIEQRIAKADEELGYAEKFDLVVVNDDLEEAVGKVREAVVGFIAK